MNNCPCVFGRPHGPNDSRKWVQELWGLLVFWALPGTLPSARGPQLPVASSSGNLVLSLCWPPEMLWLHFRLQFGKGEEERGIEKLAWRREQNLKRQSELNLLFSVWWFRPGRIWWNRWAQEELRHGAVQAEPCPLLQDFYFETAVPQFS